MKQAEHDKVVTALCEKHEEEINKLKSDSDGLINQIVTKAFNNGSRHAQKVKEPRVPPRQRLSQTSKRILY